MEKQFWGKNKIKKTEDEEKKDVVPLENINEVDIVYLRGKQGLKGDKPTKEELLALIEPLVPEKGEDGVDGDDYILTAADKKEIAGKIKVPVVKQIVERREIVKEVPIVKEVEAKYTALEIRDQLESLVKGEKLSIQAIEDLAEILQELRKERKGAGNGKMPIGGGSSNKSIRFKDDETPTGTVDGVNAAFTLQKNPLPGSLKVYRGGARQRITEDYTLTGKVITFLVAPQVGEILLADYRY